MGQFNGDAAAGRDIVAEINGRHAAGAKRGLDAITAISAVERCTGPIHDPSRHDGIIQAIRTR